MEKIYDENQDEFVIDIHHQDNFLKLKEQLEGKKFDDAEKTLDKTPWFLYPIIVNGLSTIITADMNFCRVQVVVENGIITQVLGIG